MDEQAPTGAQSSGRCASGSSPDAPTPGASSPGFPSAPVRVGLGSTIASV
jgi:hypothetical protein